MKIESSNFLRIFQFFLLLMQILVAWQISFLFLLLCRQIFRYCLILFSNFTLDSFFQVYYNLTLVASFLINYLFLRAFLIFKSRLIALYSLIMVKPQLGDKFLIFFNALFFMVYQNSFF